MKWREEKAEERKVFHTKLVAHALYSPPIGNVGVKYLFARRKLTNSVIIL
jgi:hypothetical protein